jgi:hypothetical protein
VEKRLKNEEFDRKLVDSLKKSLDMPSADSDN